jgi:hypothetical protein
MIHQVLCSECGKKLIEIEKDQITQEDIDMYKQNSMCQICLDQKKKYGKFLHGGISSVKKMLSKIGLYE